MSSQDKRKWLGVASSGAIVMYSHLNLGALDAFEREPGNCTTLRELEPGTVLLVSDRAARDLRRFKLEARDVVIWDGKTCVHLASQMRLMIDGGIFVFKDQETEAWTI